MPPNEAAQWVQAHEHVRVRKDLWFRFWSHSFALECACLWFVVSIPHDETIFIQYYYNRLVWNCLRSSWISPYCQYRCFADTCKPPSPWQVRLGRSMALIVWCCHSCCTENGKDQGSSNPWGVMRLMSSFARLGHVRTPFFVEVLFAKALADGWSNLVWDSQGAVGENWPKSVW